MTIPESVKKISEMAFVQCTGLKEIDIPLSVNEIEALSVIRLQNNRISKSSEGFQDLNLKEVDISVNE